MTEHLRPSTPLWKLPIFLALIGLLLMVGGWNLSIWCPPMEERKRVLESEILQYGKMSDDPEYTRSVEGVARQLRPMPPFELPGRLVVFGGIALFVVGVVRMYQAPKGPPRDEMPEPDPIPAEEHV